MAKNDNKITVIIPLHEFSHKGIEMLNKAIESVNEKMPIIISCKAGTSMESIGKFKFGGKISFLDKAEGDSFQELVNAAVGYVETEWFSILEYDDTYSDIWYNSAMKYIDFKTDTSVFMFFEDIFDAKDGKYLGMGNESPWASSFSDEIGYLDNQALMNYFEYYMTGSVFKKSDWDEIGGLKPHIKLTFWYEWLLRATKNDKKIFVIPKIGYLHKMGRENSLTNLYMDSMNEKEIQWWFDLAKRDFFYKKEKDPEYYVYKEQTDDEESE